MKTLYQILYEEEKTFSAAKTIKIGAGILNEFRRMKTEKKLPEYILYDEIIINDKLEPIISIDNIEERLMQKESNHGDELKGLGVMIYRMYTGLDDFYDDFIRLDKNKLSEIIKQHCPSNVNNKFIFKLILENSRERHLRIPEFKIDINHGKILNDYRISELISIAILSKDTDDEKYELLRKRFHAFKRPILKKEYDPRFSEYYKERFKSLYIYPIQVNHFDERFTDNSVISEFVMNGIYQEYINQYPKCFDQSDIIKLFNDYISLNEVLNNDYKYFCHTDMKTLEKLGVPTNLFLDKKEDKWYRLLRAIEKYCKDITDNISYLAHGCNSIILINTTNKYTLKFTIDNKSQIELLEKIGVPISSTKYGRNKAAKNVLGLYISEKEYSPIVYDDNIITGYKQNYVEGLTLEHIIDLRDYDLGRIIKKISFGRYIKETLRDKRPDYLDFMRAKLNKIRIVKKDILFAESIIRLDGLFETGEHPSIYGGIYSFTKKAYHKISAGVLNGLYELFQHNIVHMDLHPGNIIVDLHKVNPWIIDLGLAVIQTENYPTDPKDCRRYGGFDDLFSYGLILYKMATGKHLLIDYALHIDKEERKETMMYKEFESKYNTQGNASWVNQNKLEILCENGTVQEEYRNFITKNLKENGFGIFTDILIKSIGVIGYLNQQLEQQHQVTIEELKNGRKIPYRIVKPIKQQLFEELQKSNKSNNYRIEILCKFLRFIK